MSTDARSRARHYYAGSGRHLGADVAALSANPQGVVVFLPRLVVLMKPVDHARPQDWLDLAESPAGADAWYIHLLVGDLAWARQLGCTLPAFRWLCFQRGARSSTLHRWAWSRFVQSPQHQYNQKGTRYMGFNKIFSPDTPATVSTPPPTVTETQERDTQADYAQRAARRRGLLSTLLSNRNRTSGQRNGSSGGNSTLG